MDDINNNNNLTHSKNGLTDEINQNKGKKINGNTLPEILFISSYPPRECGIATYSQDLIRALNNKFGSSFSLKVCALENGVNNFTYPKEVKFILNTTVASEFFILSDIINNDEKIKVILIQHEFGLFHSQEKAFLEFIHQIKKPLVVAFHSVLPSPDSFLKEKVISIAEASDSIIVMTNKSAEVLTNSYGIDSRKITVIPHGTHLVPHLDKSYLKEKHGLENRLVLSTFGLLSSGKGIEITIAALPSIISSFPQIIFLVIGKTHPGVIRSEGEIYREKLISIVKELKIEDHVRFINTYLELAELLEYLQLSDIYLFTSNDPNQAVSGTFAYAMSCACPIISTPIPHAKEVLTGDSGILIDFGNSQQMAESVVRLLNDENLRISFGKNALQKTISTVWENSALAHANLLKKISDKIDLVYSIPEINLHHLKKMTTDFGMIQFSKINQPDIESGYTLDDNARALYSFSIHYDLTRDEKDLYYIGIFLNFIKHCKQESGNFLNYVNKQKLFTNQNYTENLDDSNARALAALSYLTTLKNIIPLEFIFQAEEMISKALPKMETIYSPRAMAYAIRALYYLNSSDYMKDHTQLVILANRLLQMYRHEAEPDWLWFESYLTYSNSILPEAMLYAWLVSEKTIYREVAVSTLNFLLSMTFKEHGLAVISNKKWHFKGSETEPFGEQSIDVADTIQTLSLFFDAFKDKEYFTRMGIAFDWFLGRNRLNQIIYNPCTGGCFDGLEQYQVNLNEGAESALSYFLSRVIIEKYKRSSELPKGFLDDKKKKEVESVVKKEEFKKF